MSSALVAERQRIAKELAEEKAAEEFERTRGEREAKEARIVVKKRKKDMAAFMETVFDVNDEASAKSANGIYCELLVSAIDAEGSTPLHKAAGSGMCELAKVILGRSDCSSAPAVIDNRGRTALHRAVTCDPTGEITRTMVEHPQCKLHATDVNGDTALQVAQDWGFDYAAAAITNKLLQIQFDKKTKAKELDGKAAKELALKQEQISKRLGKGLVEKLQKQLAVTRQMGGFAKMFKKFDLDRSGTLSADELIKLVRVELKIKASQLEDDDIRAFVVAVDEDQSGELDAKEIEQFIDHGRNVFFTDAGNAEAMGEVHGAQDKKLNDKQMKFVTMMGGIEVVNDIQRQMVRSSVKYRREGGFIAMFDKYDKGSKGSLTPDEFIKLLRKELRVKEEKLSDRLIKFFCLALDDDGNQRLEPPEIQDFIDRGIDTFFDGQDPEETTIPSGLSKQAKKLIKKMGVQNVQQLQSKLKAATSDIGVNFMELFKKFDDDESGTMSAAELKSLIRKQLKIPAALLSDKQIDSFVEALDDDGSGELSAEEIEDFIERGAATFFAAPPERPFHLDITTTAGLEAVHEGRQDDALDLASYRMWPFLNEVDAKGNTMFHIAALKGWTNVIKQMLSRHEFRVADAINKEYQTALHLASANFHAEVCYEIVSSDKFTNVNARDLSGYTALHLCALRNSQDTYDAIIIHRGIDTAMPDYKNRSAPEYAIDRGMAAVLPEILESIDL